MQREWSQLASIPIAIRHQHRGVVQSRYSAFSCKTRRARGTISKDDRFSDQIAASWYCEQSASSQAKKYYTLAAGGVCLDILRPLAVAIQRLLGFALLELNMFALDSRTEGGLFYSF